MIDEQEKLLYKIPQTSAHWDILHALILSCSKSGWT